MRQLNRISFMICVMAALPAVAAQVLADSHAVIGMQSLAQLSDDQFAAFAANVGDPHYGQYVAPNELQPELMFPLVADAPPGTLVSVGTQRCFMAAVAMSKIASARCFDIDHGVLIFNLLNVDLARVARDRHDFLFMAKDAPLAEWRKRFDPEIPQERIATLFRFWKIRFRDNPFNAFFSNPPRDLVFENKLPL